MKIFIDMDDVLNDLSVQIVSYINKRYDMDIDHNFIRSEYEIFKYLLKNVDGVDPNVVRNEAFATKGFWLNAPIKKDAYKYFELLNKEHNVYILTAPWDNEICYSEKYLWVKKNLPFFNVKKMIYCVEKNLMRGDVIVDDAPHYLKDNKCLYTIAMEYPHNTNIYNVDMYCKNWEEVFLAVQSIEKNSC